VPKTRFEAGLQDYGRRMQADDNRPSRTKVTKDYSNLPPNVRLDEAIVSVDAEPVPDPQAGRNVDQHRALRDD
jgi:hypothetical protein